MGVISCHEEAAVLQVPAKCADVGAGDHHCRRESGPTHGARGVLVQVRVISFVLTAIQIGHVTWKLLVTKHRRHRETQVVGGCPTVGVV